MAMVTGSEQDDTKSERDDGARSHRLEAPRNGQTTHAAILPVTEASEPAQDLPPPTSAAAGVISAAAHSSAAEPTQAPASTPSENFTRFGSAAPLVPPRPGPSQRPPRPTGIPRSPPVAGSALASSDLGEKNAALLELQEQLDMARRAVFVKDTEVRALLAQRDAGIAEIKQLKAELSMRDQQIELRKARVKELERAVQERAAMYKELERLAEERADRCTELAAELRVLRERGAHADDDLKLIRGIGPAFERELKKLGVRTFAQIAGWTLADIEQIAPKIKARPERILRDDWVKKAAELAARRGR
jgi:predicted flap endonuclease-1-like 5' DNA nuclease